MKQKNSSPNQKNVRAVFAVAACKLCRKFLRRLGRGGTSFPGKVALKICPDLLAHLARGIRVIIVSGTNGKTTTCHLIEQALKSSGVSLFANRSGANLLPGITAEFADHSTWRGRSTTSAAVIECDEAALKSVLQYVFPEIIVLTNIFRDQLDRYGEVTHTLDNLKLAIQKAPDAVLCLNADDSLVASVAQSAPNTCVFFGVNSGDQSANGSELSDAMYCIHCKSRYAYDYVTYAHLGGFLCPNCGYKRPQAQIAVNSITEQSGECSTVELDIHGRMVQRTIPLPAVYNIYNYLAALTAVNVFGFPDMPDPADSEEAVGFGRMEHFDIGAGITMILVKNPTGFAQVIEYLSGLTTEYDLLCCLNDKSADGTDVSWIWDVPLESLSEEGNRVQDIYAAGTRKEDMYLRLKHAGFPTERLHVVEHSPSFIKSLKQHSRPVVIVPTYTAMMKLRRTLAGKTGGKLFWE